MFVLEGVTKVAKCARIFHVNHVLEPLAPTQAIRFDDGRFGHFEKDLRLEIPIDDEIDGWQI
jgi:hypothetical protein